MIVRVKDDVAAVVFNPDGTKTVLTPGLAFDDSDPVVVTHRHMFQVDSKVSEAPHTVRSVPIEQATAAPGERRNR